MKFEKLKDYAQLPQRATADSAGYDFYVSEDIVVPPIEFIIDKVRDEVFKRNPKKDYYGFVNPLTLDEIKDLMKTLKAQPTLVPTDICCELDPGTYLELSMRSSTPLNSMLILANSVGVIDRDYYHNPTNNGSIFFQVLNLGPFAIKLKRGDRIGQGIIKEYKIVDDDNACGSRVGGLGSTNE